MKTEKAFNKALGDELWKFRKAYRDPDGKKLSQEGLGKILLLHQSAVARTEWGDQALSLYGLFRLWKRFGCDVNALFEELDK